MKAIRLLPVIIIMVFGCSSPKYLPSPKDFNNHVKGLFFKYTLMDHTKSKVAEIIEVKGDFIKLLEVNKSNGVITINKKDIKKAFVLVSLTVDNPKKINTWSSLLPITSLGHGYFAVFTLPINAITAQQSSTKTYQMRFLDDVSWNQLHKFARFPQGIPKNINESLIK